MSRRGRGMSLVIVLLLLAGIMLLAVAGLGSAIAALALAALDERAALAFEAAEAGVTRTLRDAAAIPGGTAAWPMDTPLARVGTTLEHDPPSSASPPLPGFSLGVGGAGFVLQHGRVLSEGDAGRGTRVRIEQGFAVIAPAREGLP